MKNTIFSRFPTTMDILLYVYLKTKVKTMRRISLDLKITYGCIFNNIKELEKNNLIIVTNMGREREIRLSNKGKEIALRFEEIKKIMN